MPMLWRWTRLQRHMLPLFYYSRAGDLGLWAHRPRCGTTTGQHHPKSVFNLEPKVEPGLNKKLISMRLSTPSFHRQMENDKAAPSAPPQRGGALRAPPLWFFVVSYLAVETMSKKPHGNQFFIKVRPNFWPRIDRRLWVVLALIKIIFSTLF